MNKALLAATAALALACIIFGADDYRTHRRFAGHFHCMASTNSTCMEAR